MPQRASARRRARVEPPPSERRPTLPPATRTARAFPQDRARATHQALLAAAQRVFSARGFDDAQTPEIAREAGVSVGTFYRYFEDKRQAFLEMIEAYLTRSYDRVMTELEPARFLGDPGRKAPRAAVERVLEVIFAQAASHPDLHRVFLGMSLRDSEVRRLRVEFEERGRSALAALIQQAVPPGRITDPFAAAEVIQVAAQEVALATAGGRGSSPRSPVVARALRDALADMIVRYAFGD